MHRIYLFFNLLVIKVIGWYVTKAPSYSNLYSLNYELKKKSMTPIPGTWLELDWISNHPWDKYPDFEEDHSLNSFRRQGLINEVKEIERRKVVGDFLELGVFKGFSAYTMLAYCTTPRNYVGFDTFLGLSKPIPNVDGSHWVKGDLSVSRKVALANLKEFDGRITLIQGEIPGIFLVEPLDNRQFALVHIDLDLYEPTRNALEFGWGRLSNGGSLICDDYGFSTCPGATRAVDEFLASHLDVQVIVSAVGGIVVRKHGS